MREEPLYSLCVHFDDLTDDGARMLANWIVNAPETVHMTYCMSKIQQDDPEEVTGDAAEGV